MNDRQLQELIRMAAEIERIEADAASVIGHVNGRTASPARGRRILSRQVAWWGGGVAAAAAVALGVSAIFTTSGYNATPKPIDLVVIPESAPVAPDKPAPVAVAAAHSSRVAASPGLLLAIYQDMFGDSHCVQLVPRPLEPGESIAGLSRDEMLHTEEVERGSMCSPGPHRLTVVALSGPADRLPTSFEGAEALAACIAQTRDVCSEEQSAYASAAYTCVPPGVSVRVESTYVLR